MKKTLSATAAITASVALLAPLVATADHRPGHRDNANPDLTIAAEPSPVTWPKRVTVSGILRGSDNAGKPIELQVNPHPFQGPFQTVATVATDEDGNYTFIHRPDEHTIYRVRATEPNPDEISGEVLVKSRMKVTRRVSNRNPIDGQEITFFGRVGPAHEGQHVLIQRRRPSGTWKTMTTTPLSAPTATNHSTYSTEVEINRDGVWRAKVRSDENHRGNKSRRIRIDAI